MGINKLYIYFLGIEGNDRHQTVVVPFDIENKTVITYIIDRIEILLDIS